MNITIMPTDRKIKAQKQEEKDLFEGLPQDKALILIGDKEDDSKIFFNKKAIQEMGLSNEGYLALGAAMIDGYDEAFFTLYKTDDNKSVYFNDPVKDKHFALRPAKLVVPTYVTSKVMTSTIDNPGAFYEIKWNFENEGKAYFIIDVFLANTTLQEPTEAPSKSEGTEKDLEDTLG